MTGGCRRRRPQRLRLFRDGVLRLRFLFHGGRDNRGLFRRGGRLLIPGAVGHPDLGGLGAQTQEAGLGPLQDLHGHVVPLQTQLAQGAVDGLVLGLARYVNITHGSISSFDHSAS